MGQLWCNNCLEAIEKYPCSHCGYTPADENQVRYALTGHVLAGRYLVGRILGQGGFGITYLGMDLKLGKKVAIKEFYPSGHVSRYVTMGTRLDWNQTPAAQAMRSSGVETFLREARKISKVSHIQNVVGVQDVIQENDTAYIIMNYIQGTTLKDVLAKEGPMDWNRAKEIFLPAIRTIAQVHKAGLVHRDISPDNLMLQPDGQVQILDLGAAKDISVDGGLTSALVAKAGFSPLEQYSSTGQSGTWTDVYAMAATIYYTVTGTLPPPATDRLDQDKLRWDLPRPQALPKQVVSALKNAMAIRTANRTQTMEQLLAGLTDASVKADTSQQQTKSQKKTPSKKKWFLPIAATTACMLLAVAFLFGSQPPADDSSGSTTQPQISAGEHANDGDSNGWNTQILPVFGEPVTIKVAAVETAYGCQVWADVAAAFEAETGIKVELTTDENLEDVISGPMQNGEFPDVVHLATGSPSGLTEQLIKTQGMHDLTNMLSLTIPGETVKVSEKIAGGFTDNNICAPYGDGVTYLAPMFYYPCGLFYNANLFEAKGWEVPTTWDEMWALGETAAAEGISLFTYPTAGYLDAFLFALANAVGGPEFFNAVTTYEEGAWDSENGQALLAILDKLADYTHPSTPAQANNQDYTKNQQMAMNGTALFMPNGIWITFEMADYASTLKNFAWGMTAVPSAGEDPYAFCWFEQAWIPAGAEHITEAEQFVAFLYSDTAAEIFASAGAMQPILGLADMLEGENRMFYSIYEGGAKAAMGGFAPFDKIPGVDVSSTFFTPIDSLFAGTITIEDYADLVKTNSALMRENLLN